VVHIPAGRTAAALWLQAGPDFPAQHGDYEARLAAVTGRWAERFAAFDAVLDARHPAIADHDLAILAVQPDRQGQGTGAALLHACHQHLDHDVRTPACLAASDLRTCQNYLRHGYADHGPPGRLPGGPLMYSMWRRARTALAGQTTHPGPG
jgi:GNAT superfamily N-acetyltransferase